MGGPATYRITIPLERNGAFGYTVRILPRHSSLVTPIELGLQALPAGLAG